VAAKVTWQQALAWRMRRHYLDPVGDRPVAAVVRRLCGIQAQVASSAELCVRVRRTTSKAGEVAAALGEGRLIKTWAMRGTLHLLSPEDAGAVLSLLASARTWELPSWQRYFGMTPRHWDAFRLAAREALDGKSLTRDELVTKVIARRGLGHLGEELRSGWGTLLKPLAWQGDLCFGPSRGNRVTFMRPEDASSRWRSVLDPEEAAPIVIVAYFGAYGPATLENFRNWLSRGRIHLRQLRIWFNAVGDRLREVEVDGEPAYILAEHLDDLASARPTSAVRLLPGFDQYVLGVGTEDGHVVPARRRAAVSKQSGWISPVVIGGGVVRGTWGLAGDRVQVAWFKESGAVPRTLRAEVARLSTILERELRLEVGRA
jgi:winged helix DNA-binding protein